MVKKLDLGPLRNLSSALSAEGDRNIAEYFVETGRMEDIKSGTQLVLGRKGSGKTALFLHAVNDLEDKDCVVVKLDLSRSYPIESQILFEDKGVVEHERYVRGWKFVLCLSLYLAWVDKRVLSPRERRVLKRLKNKISRIDGVESIWEWMVKSFEVKVGPFFSFSYSLKGPSVPSGANVRVVDRFIDAVLEVGQDKRFSILIDGIDPIWDMRTAESKLMIIGLLQTVREFNACAAQKRPVGGPASAICFLRTDIFNGIEYSDRNKIQGGAIRLQWQENELIDVVVRRARFLLGDESIGWNDFVTSEKMRSRLNVQGYLYRRTMERPRDLLAFVGAAARLAANRNHSQIEVQDVYDSEHGYAQHIYDEMKDETSGNREEFMRIVQGLRRIGVNKFHSSKWIGLPLWETQLDGEKVLQNALGRSIVGIERVGGSLTGGRRGGTRVEYTYAGKGVTLPAGGATVVVHPTFVKVLSLKESRKKSQ